MPAGARVRASELAKKLEALDIDEGIRIESGGRRMFVNRRASGTYVVQFDDSEDFRYLDSGKQVIDLAKSLGRNATVWIY